MIVSSRQPGLHSKTLFQKKKRRRKIGRGIRRRRRRRKKSEKERERQRKRSELVLEFCESRNCRFSKVSSSLEVRSTDRLYSRGKPLRTEYLRICKTSF
jgi:superfamily II DNA helicase RecQ